MGGCQGKFLPSSQSDDSQSTILAVDDGGPHRDDEKEPQPDLEDHQQPVAFGKPLREKYFSLDPDYHNLNHSSYGTIPTAIQARLHHYQALHERRPDHFIRYTYPALLVENRTALATLLHAPVVDDLVLVPNATTGVNTVLRGLPPSFWSPDGNDEILYFGTIYDACGKTIAYLRDATATADRRGGRGSGRRRPLVHGRPIPITYPISDAALLATFRDTVHRARTHHGRRPRLAIFDTVSSLPGVRVPYEALVAACRELGLLSLVDGAQGVGMLPLDLGALDPDFFVSNCHKWLFVPRGCAVFYVPRRNHHLVRSTLPTSHSYVPDPAYDDDDDEEAAATAADASSMLPTTSSAADDDDDEHHDDDGDGGGDSSSFAEMFAYVGTLDNSPYLCIQDAIAWRKTVLGGEDRIRAYCFGLAQDGGTKVADILGTWIMQNEEGTLVHCNMVNVALPLVIAPPTSNNTKTGADGHNEEEEAQKARVVAGGQTQGEETIIPYKDAQRIWEWMTKVLVEEYQTFIPVYYHAGRFWVRLSAQVYLDMNDFEWTGQTLKELSDRVARKEYD